MMYSQNWNIGFCEQSPEDLIDRKVLNKVQWMKHPYRDRWFADPFILKVTDSEIVVFVEECQIERPKGILCELVIDRKTKRLKKRYVLLELDTHLSYPAIIHQCGKVFVYPENGASGKLNIYEYDEVAHKLVRPKIVLDKAVADSTIIKWGGKYNLVATLFPQTQEQAFLFCSDNLFGHYELSSTIPFQSSREYSRPAGNWIVLGNQLFRPAQDCVKRYGAGISMMNVNLNGDNLQEECVFKLYPESRKYSRGLHTINFMSGICVIDGYGFLHPIARSLITSIRKLKHRFAF